MDSMTFLYGGMYMLADRYLLLGFGRRGDPSIWWVVYDVASQADAYSLDGESQERLRRLRARRGKGAHLYGYAEPAEEELDVSNGRIEVYRLEIKPGGELP